MKEHIKLHLEENPSKLKNIITGFTEKDFIFAFNINKDNVPEYSCTIPADKLKEMIQVLFNAGIEYEKEYNRKIGFSTEE